MIELHEVPVGTLPGLEGLSERSEIPDVEVGRRFDEMATLIDEAFTTAHEAAAEQLTARKVTGNAESYSMWKS